MCLLFFFKGVVFFFIKKIVGCYEDIIYCVLENGFNFFFKNGEIYCKCICKSFGKFKYFGF